MFPETTALELASADPSEHSTESMFPGAGPLRGAQFRFKLPTGSPGRIQLPPQTAVSPRKRDMLVVYAEYKADFTCR